MLFKKNFRDFENDETPDADLEIIENKTDKDVLKNPQKELSQGVESDEFDVKPRYKSEEELELDLSDKTGIEIDYTFNGKEVAAALKIFQRETIFMKNMMYTIILSIIFFIYIAGIIKNPNEKFGMFLAVLCVTVIAFIWYMPRTHIKKTAQAADSEELSFKMTVFDTCVRIGEENGSFIINYNKEITKIIETDKLFLICAGKERVFVLPKRCLDDGVVTQLKDIFKLAMQEKYIFKG